VWDELVHARHPVAIYRTFDSQTRPVKVDLVAENGARWVRVNTSVPPRSLASLDPTIPGSKTPVS